MGITSFEFILFILVSVCFFYILPGRFRPYFLFIINMVFYVSFGAKAVILIIFEATLAYFSGMIIVRQANTKVKTIICISSNILVVGILLLYKIRYAVDGSIIIPLGLSFYSLQTLSYINDVYKGKIEAENNYLTLLIYLSFFATITSGPIYRFSDFSKSNEFITHLKPDYKRITDGIVYVIYGYFIKLVVAERAAIPIEKVFGDIKTVSYSSITLWIVAILYSIRIYMDFAGYSAIVIGIAHIIGYDIPENFLAPYLSKDTKDFWGRWHVSFSSWLRDYVYIPLGGNRKGKIRKNINTLITFMVSGMWHGISLHFAIWGFVHGFYRMIGDMLKPSRKKSRVITFLLITVAWIFFRLDTKDALLFLKGMLLNGWNTSVIAKELSDLGLLVAGWAVLVVSVAFVFVCDLVLYRRNMRFYDMINRFPIIIKEFTLIGMILTILVLGIYGNQHDASYFIYRNF